MQRSELEQVAEQYRTEGYEVTVSPESEVLPDFLRGDPPDILARRDGESVAVHVKQRREIVGDHRLAYLAGEVNSQPGWRFDLVVTGGKPWPDDVVDDALEPNSERILTLLESAERLLLQGEIEASCLVAWSAVEATLRDVARRNAIQLDHKGADFVLKTLVTEGVLDRGRYQSLREAFQARNTLAHGLSFPGIRRSVPESLIETSRELLGLQPTAGPA